MDILYHVDSLSPTLKVPFLIRDVTSKNNNINRKLLFPISLQLKGTRLPQENFCCLRLTIVIRLELYMYIYIYRLPVFYFISYGARIKHYWICWNCKGCIGKSIGPVQYRFTMPSLRAKCPITRSALVTRSARSCWLNLFERTNWQKTEKASYIPLSQLGVRHHPAQVILYIRPALSHSFIPHLPGEGC